MTSPGKYVRLDLLQLDLLTLLRQASKDGNRKGAWEVGRSFLQVRDKLCGEGKDQLWSHVLTYTRRYVYI